MVLDVLVDKAGNAHGHDGVVPRRDEHQRHAHDHSQEGQRPADQWNVTVSTLEWCLYNGQLLGDTVVDAKSFGIHREMDPVVLVLTRHHTSTHQW